MLSYSRYRPCRLSLPKECSLIRHAPAVGQARIAFIATFLPFTLKIFRLIIGEILFRISSRIHVCRSAAQPQEPSFPLRRKRSDRSRNRRSKQAMPVLAPVEAVAKREGYGLEEYSITEILVFKFVHYKFELFCMYIPSSIRLLSHQSKNYPANIAR